MNEDLAYQLQMLSVAIVRTQEALQQLNLQAYGLSQRVAAQGYQVPMMQQAPQQVAGFSHAPKVGGLSQTYASVRLATQDNRLSQTASKAADAQQARGLAGQVGNLKPDLGGAAGVHVNSGPTHHTDNGGFSDFTSRFQQGLQEQVKNPGNLAGAHVNSGPTHHTDNGGFSDFTSRFQNPADRLKNPGSLAGAHVNSGPTHHTDNGGFSDFTSRFQNPADQLRNPGNLAGAHVNSGPTHHTDNGGFSDFTSRFQNPADQLRNPAGQAGAHVNSGPTHHTDNGGFSDFTSRFQNPADVLSNPAVRIGDTQVKLAENQSLRLGGYLLTKVRG